MPTGNILSSPTSMLLMQAGQSDASIAAQLKAAAAQQKETAMTAAAQDFEAMFIAEMIKPMIETVEIDEMFGGGKGEDVFRGMMTQEYGKKLAGAGGIGLASHVREALIAAQNAANGNKTAE